MKKFIKENWFKIVVIALLMVIAFAYALGQYSYYQKQQRETKLKEEKQETELKLEKARLLTELEEKEKVKEEKKEAEKNLTNCLFDAEDSYHKSWSDMCKRLGKLSKECEEILFADTYNDYLEKHPEFQLEDTLDAFMEGHEKFMEKRNECSCLLPTHHADTFDKRLKENKDECHKKYPQ